MNLPKRNSKNFKGNSGQTFFQHFINYNFNFIYHPINQENDFGIDGYVEIVIDDEVTGKLVGIQIKHGNSYFNIETDYGYKYYGENKHLNYYLNNFSPIFIVIMDDNFQNNNWVYVDIEKIFPTENGWWIEIPRNNYFDDQFKDFLIAIAGLPINYKQQIEYNRNIEIAITESSYRVLGISKIEIDTYDFTKINRFLKKLSKNKDMMIRTRSTLDIYFPEYNNDHREIFQIPEIMSWLNKSIEEGVPWFYYLNYTIKNTGLILLLNAYCRMTQIKKKNEGFLIEYNIEDIKSFWEKNFINMNFYLHNHNIGIDINKEISNGIIQYYMKYLQKFE